MNPAGGGSAGSGNGSVAIGIKVDPSTKKATKAWSYKSSAAIQVDIMGDLQQGLPNGNTVVGYSTKGELQEIDSERHRSAGHQMAGRDLVRVHRKAPDTLRTTDQAEDRVTRRDPGPVSR